MQDRALAAVLGRWNDEILGILDEGGVRYVSLDRLATYLEAPDIQ
jgi:hypothetical protein